MMRRLNDGGQGTSPAITYDLRPSHNYLFPYCALYYDVNEDSGVKCNYSSGAFGELTFSLKSFRGLQGGPWVLSVENSIEIFVCTAQWHLISCCSSVSA